MGHLVNPIAMRLGRFSYWEDIWFIDFVYYPEFLHLVLKIKSFCLFFFGSKIMEVGGFLYSHFYVLQFLKTILIRIYFFNGIHDELIETYFVNAWHYFFEDEWFLRKRDEKKRKLRKGQENFYPTPDFINAFRLFVMLKYVAKFSLRRLSKSLNVKKFLVIFGKFNFAEIRKRTFRLFRSSTKLKLNKFRFHLIFFVLIKLFIENNVYSKTKVFQNIEVEYAFLRQLFTYKTFGRVFVYVNKFLCSLLVNFIIFFRFNFRFDFFFLKNEDITSKFLSRFIARKLQQGYTLKYLMNPLKKELLRTVSVLKRFNFIGDKSNSFSFRNFGLSKGFCIKLFNILFYIIKLEFYKFYFFYHCWFQPDLFIYFYYMRNILFKAKNLISVSIFSSIFFLLFDRSYFIKDLFLSCIFFLKTSINFSYLHLIDFSNCLKILCSYMSNFEILDCFFNFIDKKDVLLLRSSFFLNSCFKYNYCLLQKYVSMGILKEKKRNIKNFVGFSGFRLKFKGRFSRRQKSSSVLYSCGNVPLTTLRTNIDYSFYTIPLKNSAISVKVWLHKNFSFEEIDCETYKYDNLKLYETKSKSIKV